MTKYSTKLNNYPFASFRIFLGCMSYIIEFFNIITLTLSITIPSLSIDIYVYIHTWIQPHSFITIPENLVLSVDKKNEVENTIPNEHQASCHCHHCRLLSSLCISINIFIFQWSRFISNCAKSRSKSSFRFFQKHSKVAKMFRNLQQNPTFISSSLSTLLNLHHHPTTNHQRNIGNQKDLRHEITLQLSSLWARAR